MRVPYTVLLVACALTLAGCDEEPERVQPPAFGEVFPNFILPPQGTFVGRSGNADALQLVFQSPIAVEPVADYYRSVLNQEPWRLVSDAPDPSAAGGIILYAEQDGPPMWVRISPNSEGIGSIIQVTGAVVASDSAAPPPDSVAATTDAGAS